jgi:hypothetical protein
MVMHIVMFTFKKNTDQLSIDEAKVQIEQLIDLVPGLQHMKVGMNFADEERAMDMVLISSFNSREDLDFYATHPEHLKVIAFIKTITEYTKVVDFEA